MRSIGIRALNSRLSEYVPLAALCEDDFEGGILFYNGRDILPLAGQDMLAVPLSELWTR